MRGVRVCVCVGAAISTETSQSAANLPRGLLVVCFNEQEKKKEYIRTKFFPASSSSPILFHPGKAHAQRSCQGQQQCLSLSQNFFPIVVSMVMFPSIQRFNGHLCCGRKKSSCCCCCSCFLVVWTIVC